MDFVNLHNHCEFSFLDGYGHPDWFVNRAKELGQTAIAITDHGNISAHKRWYDSCVKAGIKPILGIEAYIVDDITKKDSRVRFHITLWAKNLEGYRNLTRLVSLAYSDGFYFKPRIDWNSLKRHRVGIIATSGCPSGRIGQMITKMNRGVEEIKKEMLRQKAIFEDGNYFVELAPWSYEEGQKVARVVYQAATELGLPMILTNDAHYPLKEDAEKQDLLLAIQQLKKVSDKDRLKFDQQDFYLKTGQEMKESWESIYKDLPFKEEMLSNTVKIAGSVEFEFPEAKPISFPYEGDKIKLIRKLINTGVKERKIELTEEYKERIERELDLIVKKDFVDYFLVISDLVKWSKDNGIMVGPARGSSCGSLICYLTHITEIDPIPHGLLFERFIDLNRTDLPDVDIDFEDERREEVKQYLKDKYGEDRVASLATFGTFQGRLCIQDIGRAFSDRIPSEVVEEVKKLIVQRSGGDSRYGFSVEDTFVNFDNAAEHLKNYPELGFAKYFEGQVRQMGIHAAGTVVSNEPIENFAAFYRSSNSEKVISMDYAAASSVGLLKIDILGLTTLTVLRKTIELIKERHGISIDLNSLPTDDEKIYDAFKEGKLFGVFQFDGQAMMQVCRQVQPENFTELVAINGLSRPGPLHSGGTTSYINRKFAKEEITYSHPIVESITKETYGVTIYQEQVMKIVKELGNFSWKDTSTIRQTMSKSRGTEAFDVYQDKFIKGAVENGMDAEAAEKVWKNIYTFGSWAFNKSHSVAYTMIGYWCMWLKVYYPIEYYVTMMQIERSDDKLRKVIKEYINEGHTLLGVDVNKSKVTYSIFEDAIVTGFSNVVGIGEHNAEPIVKNQPYQSFIDFKKSNRNEKIANTLLELGAFKDLEFESTDSQQSLFGDHLVVNKSFDYKNPSSEVIRKFTPMALQEKLIPKWAPIAKKEHGKIILPIRTIERFAEKTTITVIGTTDPNKFFNPKNKIEEMRSKGRTEEEIRKELMIPMSQEDLHTNLYDFLNFDLEDETDYVTVRIPYKRYPEYKDFMWSLKPNDVIMVEGMVNGGIRMLFANKITKLNS